MATSTSGDLHIDLAIINETGEWSAMQAVAAKACPAQDRRRADHQLRYGLRWHRRPLPGSRLPDEGLHRPGPKLKLKPNCCTWSAKAPRRTPAPSSISMCAMLPVSTTTTTRRQDTTDVRLEVDLDKLATDLTYPIVTPVEG